MFPALYSCPLGQCVTRAFLAANPLPRKMLIRIVTGSRCHGLRQARLRQRWSSVSSGGISPTTLENAKRCTRTFKLERTENRAYPFRSIGDFQSQHESVSSVIAAFDQNLSLSDIPSHPALQSRGWE